MRSLAYMASITPLIFPCQPEYPPERSREFQALDCADKTGRIAFRVGEIRRQHRRFTKTEGLPPAKARCVRLSSLTYVRLESLTYMV